jgi:uncharacterized membrane protein
MVPDSREAEPRWPVIVSNFATGLLFYAMPESLTVGPSWLLLVIVAILSIPSVITRRLKRDLLNEVFGYSLLALVTVAVISSLALLILRLPSHRETPTQLLEAAAALWLSNVLVFASWYWRLDGGGPNERDKRGAHTDGAFLFPQMQVDPDVRKSMGDDRWSPGFIDYLFLAFNTSTAFSPTDTAVLARWGKALMMTQSIISLTVLVLLAARAVNIL